MNCVILVQHSGRNVWNITSCVTFASDIDLKVGDSKRLLPVQEEADKVHGNILFTSSCDISIRKASPNRLFDPKDICEVDPRVRIDLRLILSPTPNEQTVFLKETFQRTTTRSSIEPNCNLIHWCTNCWLEDPEKCSRWIGFIDWDVSRVHFTNIEINFWKRSDLEC